MRSYAVILLIMLTVAVVALAGRQKFRQHPDDIHWCENRLAPLRQILPEQTAFSVKLINTPVEYMLYARYFLEPRFVYCPEIKTDTVLVINANHGSDSTLKQIMFSKRVLWQGTEGQYTFTLICSR